MAGLVSICCCAGGRLMSLGRPSPLSSAHCSVLEGLKVVWLVYISRCNHGRLASFRKAFGLPALSTCLLVKTPRHLSEGTWQR